MDEQLRLLSEGEIDVEGLLPWGSNYTFRVQVCQAGDMALAVYKPQRGERPLWDFPKGSLANREVAAFQLSDALGWHLVPPTILRDGPYGQGSLQLYVDHSPEEHYFTFEEEALLQNALQRICYFDTLINNGDRKSGHVLRTDDGRLWAIDHGVSFHSENKLRTVIWAYAGQPVPDAILADARRLLSSLREADHPVTRSLSALLSAHEMEALRQRIHLAVKRGIFPQPGAGRHSPWPPV